MHCRIVFIETKPGGLVIDALSSSGEVVAMDAQVPVSAWGFAATLVLGRWAELGSQVDVDLHEKRGAHRVRLTDDEHLVVLDLTHPATVSRVAGEHLGKEGSAGRGPVWFTTALFSG